MNWRKLSIALRVAAVLLAVGVLQMGFFNELRLFDRACEPLLTLAASAGLTLGTRRALIVGLFAGLLYDILSGLPIGLAMFAYTFTAIVAGRLGEYVARVKWRLVPPLTALGFFIYVIVGEVLGQENFFDGRFPATLAVVVGWSVFLAPAMFPLSLWMWMQPVRKREAADRPLRSPS